MSRRDRKEVQVAFHDAPTYFSEEEWKLLQEWQKELYGNVMKEIHQALISLGPLITTTVYSLGAKEKQKQCSVDIPGSKRRHSINRSQSDPMTSFDACFIINTEEHVHPNNLQDTRGQETSNYQGNPMISSDECFIVNTQKDVHSNYPRDKKEKERKDCLSREEEPSSIFVYRIGEEVEETPTKPDAQHGIISFNITDKEEPNCMNHGNNTKEDSILSPTEEAASSIHIGYIGEEIDGSSTDTASWDGDIALHTAEKEETSCMDHENSGREESIVSPTGHGIISFSMNDEEETYCMDHEKNTGIESTHSPAAVPVITAVFSLSTKLEEEMCAQTIKSEKMASEELSDTGRVFGKVSSACCESKQSFPHKSTSVNYQIVHTDEEHTTSKNPKKKRNANCTQQKKFSCSDCKKSFTRISVLQLHQTIHTGEKPFPCSECEKSFTRKISLKRHQLIHTGDNPFPCTECNKSFLYKSELRRHRVCHTGEKPYVCTECGNGFFQKRLLVQHQIVHIEVKPVVPEETYSEEPSLTSPKNPHKNEALHGVETLSFHLL